MATGTGESRMCWMMSSMEVDRPPGVSIVIRTRLAWRRAASSIPLSTYSAMTGSISSPMRNSMTCAAPAEEAGDGAGACPCARNASAATRIPQTQAPQARHRRAVESRRLHGPCGCASSVLSVAFRFCEPAPLEGCAAGASPADRSSARSNFIETRARRASAAGS